MEPFLRLLRLLAQPSRPDIRRKNIVDVFQVLPDFGIVFVLLLIVPELAWLPLLSQVGWHEPVEFVLHDVQALDVSQLYFLPGILHLLDSELHFVEVSLYSLFVLLIRQVDVVETLGEFIPVSFHLQVVGVGLVQLPSESYGQGVQAVF